MYNWSDSIYKMNRGASCRNDRSVVMNINEKEIRRLSDQIKWYSCLRQKQPHNFHTISSPSIHGCATTDFISNSFQPWYSLFLRFGPRPVQPNHDTLGKSVSMGPKKDTKKDTKGGKGKGKEPKDTSDGDDKGKGKGLKAANSINVRHILVCIPTAISASLSMFIFLPSWERWSHAPPSLIHTK